MSETGLLQIIEGALLAAGKPMTVAQLAELFEEHERPENDALREALAEVAERCEGRGFELQEVASGFRFQVRQNLSPWVARLWQERPQKYSRALLETLALIAYRQPITRGEIEEIRGVAVSSNIIKTLHEREWIRVVGHRDVPGRPAMYATTKQFLDYFNLKSLDQLPALAEIRDFETLTAELGFNELLPEKKTESSDSEGPGLTVVGGTEHTPTEESEETVTLAEAADELEQRAEQTPDADADADAEPAEAGYIEVDGPEESALESEVQPAGEEQQAPVEAVEPGTPVEARQVDTEEDAEEYSDIDSPAPEHRA